MTKVTDRERPVLMALSEIDEDYCAYLKTLAANTGIDQAELRRRIRALARKGLAVLRRGLSNEFDGLLCGSGYQITKEGRELAAALKGETNG